LKYKLPFIIIFSILLVACHDKQQSEANQSELFIYTSIYPIQFITEQIAGEIATVESIYPPGVDAHTYEPTSREMTQMANSDAFIYLGNFMEVFAEKAVATLESQNITFIEIGAHEDLFKQQNNHHGHDDGHHHSDFDPHIWLDPLRMIEMATIINHELIKLAPDHKDQFNENLTQLVDKLNELDQQFIERLEQKTNKTIIVSHAAYGYWEERYDLEQIPLSGMTSLDEPSQKELAKIAGVAQEKNIGYVLFEQNSSNRLANVIQDYLEAEALYLHNLEILTEEDIKNNDDYFSLMKANLDVLDQATE